jgi:hypothetical protein
MVIIIAPGEFRLKSKLVGGAGSMNLVAGDEDPLLPNT